jgi:hypothetical protein
MGRSEKKRLLSAKPKSRKSQLKFQKRLEENHRVLKSLEQK